MKSDRLGGVKTLAVGSFLDEFEKDEIKKRIDIVNLFESFGTALEKKGSSYVGLCPFHADKNPSLSVNREKGLFNCFGCGASGDIFDVVKLSKGLGFREAISYFKEYEPVKVERKVKDALKPLPKKLEKKDEEPVLSKKTISLKEVSEYYSKVFYKTKKAISYLEKRGIKSTQVYKTQQIGYCDGSLIENLSEKQTEELYKSGIVKKNEKTGAYYEHFKGCVVVPQIDKHGQVVGFYGRKILDGSMNHLYLQGEHKGLVNHKAPYVYKDKLLLTESVLDALSFISAGIENVTACYGTNGFSDVHLEVLREARVKRVIIAFDNDAAGRTGSEKLRERLLEEGLEVAELYPQSVKDWNELLINSGNFKKDVEALLENLDFFQTEAKESIFTVRKQQGVHIFERVGLSYRVLGVKDIWVSNLKVNIRVEIDGSTFPDNVDLYSARSRTLFSQNISRIFGLEVQRIENDLIEMLKLLEAERDSTLSGEESEQVELSEEERELGLSFLRQENLFEEIIKDTEILGYVGDDLNKQLMYLCASSRLMDDPISIIVISQSSAGKSYLIDTVKKLMPPEEVVSMTSLSDQALNYLPEGGLLNKFMVMGEAVHGEVVEHQIREMLSAKELSRLVTTKDEKTGKLVTKNVKTKVVVASVMSTTNWDINNENASRVFLISADESIEQTKKIHEAQRKKYSLSRYHEKKTVIPEIVKKHQAAQRLLKNRVIVNPFADLLDFPDALMRTRRDNERFIDLISTVCFLRQYQKEEKETDENGLNLSYIECDIVDYGIAYRILKGVLPATLTNFPRSALTLYDDIRAIVKEKALKEDLSPTAVAVTQREIREITGHSQMFVKRYIRLLYEYEYVKTGGSRGKGVRNSYYLVEDEDIHLLDLSRIPEPEEMRKKVAANQ